jgi:transcriptional regulator with XRE-family HTH domain
MDGDWLRARREALELTQAEYAHRLSRALGQAISRTTVSHWEVGRRPITPLFEPQQAVIMARTLNWTLIELLNAAGYPITPVHIDELDIPAEVYIMLRQMLQASEGKRTALLRMFDVMYQEYPDDITTDYIIPSDTHLPDEEEED